MQFHEMSDVDPTQQQLSDDRYGTDSGDAGAGGQQIEDLPVDEEGEG